MTHTFVVERAGQASYPTAMPRKLVLPGPPVSPRTRHTMQSIGRENTAPERAVRSSLHSAGLRFRLHVKDLPGSPDIVLPKWRTIVFVHGCFWHRHAGCRFSSTPKIRTDYWTAKFDRNVKRDRLNRRQLKALGWRVVQVWECEVKDGTFLRKVRRVFPAGIGAKFKAKTPR